MHLLHVHRNHGDPDVFAGNTGCMDQFNQCFNCAKGHHINTTAESLSYLSRIHHMLSTEPPEPYQYICEPVSWDL